MEIAKLRRKALAHVEMMRPYTMFHSGLLAIAGAELASAGHVAVWRTALAALVTMCGWEAGLYAGDYYDRNLDAVAKPARPVPSGRVSAREARLTMIGLICAGYICALILGPANLGLAALTTALGIAYSKTFKNRAILGNLDRGILGICAVLFGALAGGAIFTTTVLMLCALVFFHDSATNLVGAIRDIEGDRAAGYHTVPTVYGLALAVDIACGLALTWIILGAALMAALRPSLLGATLFAVAVLLAVYVYVPLWLTRATVSRKHALAAHKYLIAERLILVSAFIAVYAPAPAALGILVAALVASLVFQALLRDRYEQQRIPPAYLEGGLSHQ
ncbi:MAG TPA: UbiA family prenyltransferase [Ktedonobacterales bacterium]|nr:UbiA family prenyltransferase [Ktedonobacterales bacterium]